MSIITEATEMEQIFVITTGGYVDAEQYDFRNGNILKFRKQPAIVVVFHESVIPLPSEDESNPFGSIIMMEPEVDVRGINEGNLKNLLGLCKESKIKRILITCCTDAMKEAGEKLAKLGLDKTVVLTGGPPYTYYPALAAGNIIYALGVCQLKDYGVYIAMYGCAIPASSAVKIPRREFTYFIDSGVPVRHTILDSNAKSV